MIKHSPRSLVLFALVGSDIQEQCFTGAIAIVENLQYLGHIWRDSFYVISQRETLSNGLKMSTYFQFPVINLMSDFVQKV